MKKICVIGSLNMDLVAEVVDFPRPGETIKGKSFGMYPGGKGANQAVSAARLGGEVLMVGKLGKDIYGVQYIKILEQNGIKLNCIETIPEKSSGIAIIEVDNKGENHIVIIPGANEEVDEAFIDKMFEEIMKYDIFLFQLEIPMKTTIHTMKRLKEVGKLIILDPAPAQLLPDEIYTLIDYITPNESEMKIMTGYSITNEKDIKEAAKSLLDKGVKNVIAKVGNKGAYLVNQKEFIYSPGFKVEAVDTTGAGDSFNGGFSFALAMHKMPEEGIKIANAVAAISVTKKGAQSAMPTLNEVHKLLEMSY